MRLRRDLIEWMREHRHEIEQTRIEPGQDFVPFFAHPAYINAAFNQEKKMPDQNNQQPAFDPLAANAQGLRDFADAHRPADTLLGAYNQVGSLPQVGPGVSVQTTDDSRPNLARAVGTFPEVGPGAAWCKTAATTVPSITTSHVRR